LGAHFYPLVVNPKDLIQAIQVPFDEPLADQALLPTLLLSQLTRKQVKVVLTGEGADEILAGYSNYAKKLKEASLCDRLHRSFLPYLYPLMPEKLRKSRICKAMKRPLSRRHTTIPNLFDRETYRSLLKRDFLLSQETALESIAERYYFECDSQNFLDKMLHIDTRLWLADDLLTKVDRASMAHSLEARVPYLDHRVVELTSLFPCEWKLKGNEGKFLLKKLAKRGFLPEDIINRPKKGFTIPLGDWMEQELKPLLDETLSEGGLLGRNIFRKEMILRLRNRKQKSDATRLFALLSLELWFQKFAPNYRFSS
jgi:asparagine synthase (glutamine-hydrolysing)